MSDASSAQPLHAQHPPDAEEQRREHPRFGVDLDVSLGSDRNFYSGFAENLSGGGVFVATHLLRPIGENVEICIHLPDGSEVRGRGEVRWVRLFKAEGDIPPGMGVRFIELDAASNQAIALFLRERDPMFFDRD